MTLTLGSAKRSIRLKVVKERWHPVGPRDYDGAELCEID